MAEQGALSGLRVIDLCNQRGEMAGRVLADLGAEVICIEPPGGSASRRRPPFVTGPTAAADTAAERSLWWETMALGKRSVVLDLENTGQRERLLALIDSADVLIESFAPGYLAGLGLGYTQLAARHPGLVMASITAFGQDGPLAHAPATDLTIECAGGLVGMQGDPDRPPLPVGMPQASLHAGVQAAADILLALVSRALGGSAPEPAPAAPPLAQPRRPALEQSGFAGLFQSGGQYLDVSAQSAVVWTLMNATGWPSVVGSDPPGFAANRAEPRLPLIPGMRPLRMFACADGHAVIGLHLPGIGERTLAGLVGWLHEVRADLVGADLAAVDWTTWMNQVRSGQLDVDCFNRVFDALSTTLAQFSKAELLALAVERKLLIAPVLSSADLLDDAQLASRDFWVELGGLTFAGAFARLSATPIELRSPAPTLGQHQHLLPRAALKPATAAVPAAQSMPRTRALQGLKVADFAWVGVGPIIAKALADHGADTIHIESSRRMDILRQLGPFLNTEPGVNRSQFFANFNTSKRSIDLDLTRPDDLALAHEIAEWADVLVESFVPGTVARYGLDYAALAARNPRLIMLSTCMRGQTGPQRGYSGFGNQGAALSGLFSITGWPDRAPVGPWGAYTDFIAPRFGVAAIGAALLHRQVSGRGQYIDLSQIEAGIQFMGPLPAHTAAGGPVRANPGMHSLYACPHGVYTAAGKQSFVALAVETDAQWDALADLLGQPQWRGWAAAERRAQTDRIEPAVAAWVGGQPSQQAVAACLSAGVPASCVLWPSDLHADPQLEHREFFRYLEHAEMGRVRYDGHVTRFSGTPPQLDRPGPCLGQHSEEIRAVFATKPG